MRERLLRIIYEDSIEIIELPFKGNTKGLYADGMIALSDRIETRTEYDCILAEEIGHHMTSYGNILNMKSMISQKQEHRARAWAFKEMVMFPMIIEGFRLGYRSWHEFADFMGVTEEFLKEAIKYFNQTYGCYKIVGNYIIYFEPFGVFETLDSFR